MTDKIKEFIKSNILKPFTQDRPKRIEQKEITPLYSLESDKIFRDLK